MSDIRLRVRANRPPCDPAIPGSYDIPLGIRYRNLKGKDWTWNGSNITLVRVHSEKTIADHLDALRTLRKRKVLRAVQACELSQISVHEDMWDQDWKKLTRGGRIFFAGTVYELVYNDRTVSVIWCVWYDDEAHDWFVDCVPTSLVLRSDDFFACVPYDAEARIPDSSDVPTLAPMRRTKAGVRHKGLPYEAAYTLM